MSSHATTKPCGTFLIEVMPIWAWTLGPLPAVVVPGAVTGADGELHPASIPPSQGCNTASNPVGSAINSTTHVGRQTPRMDVGQFSASPGLVPCKLSCVVREAVTPNNRATIATTGPLHRRPLIELSWSCRAAPKSEHLWLQLPRASPKSARHGSPLR